MRTTTRRVKRPKPWEGHCCGECAFPTLDTKEYNKNYKGEYFLLRCPHQTAFKGARFIDEGACEKFKPK